MTDAAAVRISVLYNKRAAVVDSLPGLADDAERFDSACAEIDTIDATIRRAQIAIDKARALARPFGGGDGADVADSSGAPLNFLRFSQAREQRACWTAADYVAHARSVMNFTPTNEDFGSFGEFLRSVVINARNNGERDTRLQRAPIGAGETDASAGGFLVQTDFANSVWTRAYDMGEILSRVMKLPISDKANGIKLPAVDESSRVTGSRWGGVQSYWLAEGDQPAATKPKFG
jgi:HK97 family phage major capsid protein